MSLSRAHMGVHTFDPCDLSPGHDWAGRPGYVYGDTGTERMGLDSESFHYNLHPVIAVKLKAC